MPLAHWSTGIQRFYLCCTTILVLFILQPSQSAWALDTSLNASLLGGELTLGNRNPVELDLFGTGLGAQFGLSETWTLILNLYQQEGDERVIRRVNRGDVHYDARSIGIGMSYTAPWGWLSSYYQRSWSDTSLVVANIATGTRQSTFDENHTSWSLSMEAGKQWLFTEFEINTSMGLTTHASETDLTQVVPTTNNNNDNDIIYSSLNEEDADGIDMGVYAQMTHVWALDSGLLVIPAIGLAYQRVLSGDTVSSSATRLQSANQSRTFFSGASRQSVDEDDQATLDILFGILGNVWAMDMSVSMPWLNDPKDSQWQLTLSRTF